MELMEDALAIFRKSGKSDTPDNYTILAGLALCNSYIGNYDKAIDMEKQVLDFRGRRLGERHPDYCLSMKEIAKRYYLIGDYANASDYIMKATKLTEDEIMSNFSDMTSVERTLYWDVNAGWLNEWIPKCHITSALTPPIWLIIT